MDFLEPKQNQKNGIINFDLRWLEKITSFPQMVIEWWYTMVECKQSP